MFKMTIPTWRAYARLILVAPLLVIPGDAYADSVVWTWGRNAYGELGDGTTTERHTPGAVSGLPNVQRISGGAAHSAVLKTDGTVWTWGYNVNGQLGDGTTADRSTPGQVYGLTDVVGLVSPHLHNLAIRSDGSVWGWGRDIESQLGDRSGFLHVNQLVPVQTYTVNRVIDVAGGYEHGLAVEADDTVWGWGGNDVGQVGDGTVNELFSPVRLNAISAVTAVAAAGWHSVALKRDGTVYVWGWYGYGTECDCPSLPSRVPELNGIIAVAAGYYHTLALKFDGTVWAAGGNAWGQLGDGTFTDRVTFAPLTGLSGVTAIACGERFSLALKADGTVWAWGDNTWGQLGDNSTVNRTLPAQVSGLTGVTSIAAGGGHSLALVSESATDVHVENASGAIENVAILTARLTRRSGCSPIVGKTVTFLVDGVTECTSETDNAGIAHANWMIRFSYGVGDHTVTVRFSGDSEAAAGIGSGVLHVTKNVPRLTWNIAPWYRHGQIGETVILTAQLVNGLTLYPMEHKRLIFTLDGTEVGRNNTGAYGLLSLPVTLTAALGSGSKTLKATFEGDDLFDGTTAIATYPIYKTDPVVSIDSASGKVGQSVTLSAHLSHSWTHAPLPDRKLVFIVAGRWVGTAITDTTGTASLSYTIPAWLGTGAKSITVRFDSDSTTYSASSTSDSLHISP